MNIDSTSKLEYFASLPKAMRLNVAMNLDKIIRDDLNMRSVVLFRGGYFDTDNNSSRPSSMKDTSIRVYMSTDINELTFEKKYANIIRILDSKLKSLRINNSSKMRYIDGECYDMKTLTNVFKLGDEIEILDLDNRIGIFDLLSFFSAVDTYKIDSYNTMSTSDELDELYDATYAKIFRQFMHVIAQIIRKRGYISEDEIKTISASLWSIQKAFNVPFKRYQTILDKISDGEVSKILSGYHQINSLSTMDDVIDIPDVNTVDNDTAVDRRSSASEFLMNNDYDEECYKFFSEIVPRILYKDSTSLNIPFNATAALLKNKAVTNLIRIPHDKSKEIAVVCKYNGDPYVLYTDLDHPVDISTEGSDYLIKGIQLSNHDDDYKMLSLKVSNNTDYEYVFDEFD